MASELKQKTIKGLAWSSIQNLTNRGVEFLLMLFMARLLSPKEYGIIGLTSVFMTFSSTLTDSGFSNALIRKKDATNEDYSTVFIFNNCISITCYIIIFFIAPWVADFYSLPILCPVLRVLGLQTLIQGLCSVQNTLLNKNINFKKIAHIYISRNIISGLIGLYFAWKGYGVWALVIQALIASLISTILLWTTTSWHPSFIFSKSSFHNLFGYGSKLLITNLINNVYGEIYPIVIGKFFSPATLGHYARAKHWARFPSANFTSVLQGVTFPVLSKIQDEEERLRTIYRKMIKTSSFIVFPMMLGLAAVGKPLVFVAIGPKWDLCARLLPFICFTLMWYPINALNLNLLQVKGKSDLFLKVEIIKKFIALPILIFSIPYGILTLVMVSACASILYVFINTYYTGKLINVGFLKQMRDVTPSLILSFLMFAIVFIVVQNISSIYLQLIVGILIGAAFYIGCAYMFKFSELQEAITIFKDIKNRKKK